MPDEKQYIQEDDGDIEIEWYARSHRSVKNVPYTVSRRGEKQLLQQRRKQRVLRLGFLD